MGRYLLACFAVKNFKSHCEVGQQDVARNYG